MANKAQFLLKQPSGVRVEPRYIINANFGSLSSEWYSASGGTGDYSKHVLTSDQ